MQSYRSRPAFLALICGMLVAAGCRRATETTVEVPEKEQEPAGRSAEPMPSSSDGPAATWQHAVDDAVRGDATDFANALPADYRADLDRMLDVALEPSQPEVRREAADAIADLAQTLARKEQLVLNSERFNFGGPAAPFVRSHFAALCRAVAAVANWLGWSAAEAPEFAAVAQEVARAMAAEPSLREGLAALRFENADAPGRDSTGRIIVTSVSPVSPDVRKTIPVVRVEQCWLPRALVDHWSELFGAARAAELAADASQRKIRLRDLASRLREITASLEMVKTQAEFDALVDRASTLLMASAAEASTMPRRVEPDEFVTVVVRGGLSDEQKDQLVWELASLSDEPASGLADALEQPGGDAYVIHVGPVHDVAAFAERLKLLAVENVDEGARKITARVAAP